MNTFTKLSAKTLIQLLAIAMITLTLFSCGGSSTAPITPPATDTTGDGSDDTTGGGTPPVTTTISATAAKVSTLSALATGKKNEVAISWGQVAGVDSYRLYQSTTTLSNYQNASPTNLSTSSTVTFTTHTINASTITLNDAQTAYFLVTTIEDTDNGKIESYTNTTQTAATAFAMPFLTVVSTGTGFTGSSDITDPNYVTPTNRVWMDRNLGASRVATSSTDTLAYGDLYQWGRSADGHQAINSATRTTLAGSITPTHGQFIATTGDWTTADSSGTLRSAYWGKTDGSSICPTGFKVPTNDELGAEFNSWFGANTIVGAYASSLKLPVAGYRSGNNTLSTVGSNGSMWSVTLNDSKSGYFRFAQNGISELGPFVRSQGLSVRCIKPE